MIRLIKDKRRARAAKKQEPSPKPEWAEAFMILLLHKTGGTLTVSIKSLENFGKLTKNNKTLISYDPDNETITIRAPEVILKPLTNIGVGKGDDNFFRVHEEEMC